jgi:hypothetical protein
VLGDGVRELAQEEARVSHRAGPLKPARRFVDRSDRGVDLARGGPGGRLPGVGELAAELPLLRGRVLAFKADGDEVARQLLTGEAELNLDTEELRGNAVDFRLG